MAKHKSLVISYKMTKAIRGRTCKHNSEHAIAPGQIVLEVRVGLHKRPYCAECAKRMVQEAELELASLKAQLNQPLP